MTEPTTTPPPSLLIRVLGIAGVAVALGTSLVLASSRHRAEAQEASRRDALLRSGVAVRTAVVAQATPGRTVTHSGEVRGYRQATLYAKVSGYLKMIRVDKGDPIKEGEVLGIIEAPEVEQQVASKQADLAIKKLTDARYAVLAKSGVVSQQEMDRASADVNIANADLLALTALRGYEVIRAPFTGVITTRHADPGALLQAATASVSALPLVDVADLTRVRVYVYLAQSEALFAKEGDPVTLWTDERPELKWHASITRFTREIDQRSRTMLTEIEMDNREANLYPGTFVRVAITLATPPALSVPADTLVFQDDKTQVAVVQGGHAHFVVVDVGDSDGKVVRVRSGLAAGDVVVLHPGDDVVEGAPVQAVPSK